MTMLVADMFRMLNRLETKDCGYVIATFYKFVHIDQVDLLCTQVQQVCDKNRILGTILLADEGINGTISAPRDAMASWLNWIEADGRFNNLSLKISYSPAQPFLRMKVRSKREIVTMGYPEINPAKITGTYVDPINWNKVIADPDVLLIDTRNTYETSIGMFANAVDPMTKNFRDFPEWAQSLANQSPDQRPKKIAMYCTGGIRCEKASALMKDLGFAEVYHLKGGILKYLEDVPPSDSKWQGECFVFDGRVAVDHGLKPGSYTMCHACRMPLSAVDLDHPDFEDGISCSRCKPTLDLNRAARFAERQKQIRLAKERGEMHLGRNPRQKHSKPKV